MNRAGQNLLLAARWVYGRPVRAALLVSGMSLGVVALVATVCLVEGTIEYWQRVLLNKSPEQAFFEVRPWGTSLPPELLAAFEAQFAGQVASVEPSAKGWRVVPGPEQGRALATATEVYFLDRGQPVQTFWHESATDRIARISEDTRALSLLFGAAGVLCLISGLIGLFGFLYTAGKERAIELAIRRVEGARRRDILFLLSAEAMYLTLLGIAFGIPVGILTAQVVAQLIHGAEWATPAGAILQAAAVLFAAGILFGFVPALRAAWEAPAAVLGEDQ